MEQRLNYHLTMVSKTLSFTAVSSLSKKSPSLTTSSSPESPPSSSLLRSLPPLEDERPLFPLLLPLLSLLLPLPDRPPLPSADNFPPPLLSDDRPLGGVRDPFFKPRGDVRGLCPVPGRGVIGPLPVPPLRSLSAPLRLLVADMPLGLCPWYRSRGCSRYGDLYRLLTSRILSKVFSMLLRVAASLACTQAKENGGIQRMIHAFTATKECADPKPLLLPPSRSQGFRVEDVLCLYHHQEVRGGVLDQILNRNLFWEHQDVRWRRAAKHRIATSVMKYEGSAVQGPREWCDSLRSTFFHLFRCTMRDLR